MVQQVMNLTKMQVPFLASLSRLRIQHCRELWCRLQTRLGFCVAAVDVASSCSFDLTPSLGTSICYRCDPKKKKEGRKSYFELYYLELLNVYSKVSNRHFFLLSPIGEPGCTFHN